MVITLRLGSRSLRYHYARFADGSTAVISLDGADMSKR